MAAVNTEPIVRPGLRPRGERRRSSWPSFLLVVGTVAALAVTPYLLLRPRVEVYTLRLYETAVVERGTLVDFVRGVGRLTPRVERTVSAPAAGVIGVWQVAEGDQVGLGQTLGALVSSDVQMRLTEAQQAVGGALHDLEAMGIDSRMQEGAEARALAGLREASVDATTTAANTQALFLVGAVPRIELDRAQATQETAEAALAAEVDRQSLTHAQRLLAAGAARERLAEAQARFEQAQAQVAALELRAPLAGLVTAVTVPAGEPVVGNQVLVRLAGTDQLRVEAELSEAQAARVGVGQAAILRVAGEDHQGRVVFLAPQAHASQDGSFQVRVVLDFDAPPPGLRLGSSVGVEIEAAALEDALYLPRGQYLSTGAERLAYVVAGDMAVRHAVIFGLVDGNRVEVRDGLSAGDRVITSSYEAFKDKAEIHLAPGGEVP